MCHAICVSRRFPQISPLDGRRPKILLVDDHRQVLETVSEMLSADFDVAGLATDGAQAIDVARQVQPDAIVLDVEMPGMDGFETFRALKQNGTSTTPVVFLSMHDEDAIVREAFKCGGRGYVTKTRVALELVTALDQALLGRLFVPSLSSLCRLGSGCGHAMQVHDDVESTVDEVAAFFDVALRRGDATCVIGTSRFRERLGDRLRARGWDVGGLAGHDRYLAVDTADALNRFVRNGDADPDGVAKAIEELDQYRLAVGKGPTSQLTIFGNTAGTLSAQGNIRAALELESLWSSGTASLPFLTVCGYGSSCFHEFAPNLWPDVCAAHGALRHAVEV